MNTKLKLLGLVAGVMFFSLPAAAAIVYIGEQFDFVATQTSGGGAGGTGTGAITIGTPTSGGFYTVSDGSFISALKGCLTCDLLSQNLSNLFFNSATLGAVGTVTGTYRNELGDLHDFYLRVTDAPTLNWDFIKHNQVSDITKESYGTYYLVETVSSAVPELSTWAMMLIGFAGIGFVAYRRTKKNTPALIAA